MKIRGYAAWLRKGIVAGVGFTAQLVALGVLHGTALAVAEAVLAVAATAGVVVVRNADKPV